MLPHRFVTLPLYQSPVSHASTYTPLRTQTLRNKQPNSSFHSVSHALVRCGALPPMKPPHHLPRSPCENPSPQPPPRSGEGVGGRGSPPGYQPPASPGGAFRLHSLGEPGPSAAALNWLWRGYLASGQLTLLTSLWKSGKTTLL